MTELRYLPDADDVYSFTASVVEVTDEDIVVDCTYFYPEGGGQPSDFGTFEWDGGRARVVYVRKDHGGVRHELGDREGGLPALNDEIRGRIDPERRHRLSRMHTAQHVVSRVVLDEFGGQTAGNQIHVDRSRIDFEPVAFDADDLETIESVSNAAIDLDHPIVKTYKPRAEVERQVDDGRALLDLIPASVDPLRVVEIESFDMCPCGGTHVDRLGEIGPINITHRMSKGADTERIEFELEG